MAEVLARSSLVSPCGDQCSLSLPSVGRRNPSFVAIRRGSCRHVEALKSSSRSSHFHGRRLVVGATKGRPLRGFLPSISAQMTLCVGKSSKWWEKCLHPNIKVIDSAQDLVDTLQNAGDKLVIVDFFFPGCGGCRTIHPKICQFAEMNTSVLFLQINHEKHKSMCYSLNVHVLPFFRFYRGANGRLCSFSCTNATIKKFKDALAKHSTDRCNLGPAKGLEESELLALAANKDLSFSYTNKPVLVPSPFDIAERAAADLKLPVHLIPRVSQGSEKKTLVTAQG
ncbi:thioredoxin-like 1-2, chloroplastic [Canna indica]|uniref:Thioredoxin-like 1-2, chloroplastic n=1 Tax=Canna indica TaxID=4628 RepID=A0AAQ3JQV2_9LILI|nr:thioredoxin-like 1-2, chloroplastic [Canna indica]